MDNPWPRMYEDFYAVKRIMHACRLLKKHCPSGAVVEVGAFKGISEIYLNKEHEYIQYDCEKFTPKTNVIDLNKDFHLVPCEAVLCLEVLEHVLDPFKVLHELTRVCHKPSGIIVISLPNEATLFHRLRALFGVVDAECFSSSGKHIHLPSLNQSIKFLQRFGHVIESFSYINPSATGSRQGRWFQWMRWIPDWVWQALADRMPSLFARGWIFVLKPHQNVPA